MVSVCAPRPLPLNGSGIALTAAVPRDPVREARLKVLSPGTKARRVDCARSGIALCAETARFPSGTSETQTGNRSSRRGASTSPPRVKRYGAVGDEVSAARHL
jgi:hypothetical protein